jgi:hypothetical protein
MRVRVPYGERVRRRITFADVAGQGEKEAQALLEQQQQWHRGLQEQLEEEDEDVGRRRTRRTGMQDMEVAAPEQEW